jgi:hypothetical protein
VVQGKHKILRFPRFFFSEFKMLYAHASKDRGRTTTGLRTTTASAMLHSARVAEPGAPPRPLDPAAANIVTGSPPKYVLLLTATAA